MSGRITIIMKKFLVFNFKFSVILLFLFLYSGSVFAVQPPEDKTGSYVYHFFVYYDHGQLFGDKDYDVKYEVAPGEFVSETITTPNIYKVEIINFNNKVVKTFQFDPQNGNPNFLTGKVVIQGPYVADGLRAIFYSPDGQNVLSIFVSNSSFCNDDLSCDAARGENTATCPIDCKVSGKPVLSAGSDQSPSGSHFFDYMFIITVAAFCAAGWIAWKWLEKKREQSQIKSEPPNFFNNNQ